MKNLIFIKLFVFFLLSTSFVACDKNQEVITEDVKEEPLNKLSDGYVLYSFLTDKTTHLIDTSGNVVKTWSSSYPASGAGYLSSEKNLLRSGKTRQASTGSFSNGGCVSGIIEELDGNSNVVWYFQKDDDNYTLHHDFKEIDNNTIIALAWNLFEFNGKTYWNDNVIMIDKRSNSIIWEWSGFDDGKFIPSVSSKEDFIHFNSIDYKNGQILVSSRNLNTIYLIDKSDKQIIKAYTGNGKLSGQHDAGFLENGNIIVFNNMATASRSAVLEINPMDEITWEFSNDFYSLSISGVQRLKSGNTIICSGNEHRFIEITQNGEIVWDYTPENTGISKKNIFKMRKYSDF